MELATCLDGTDALISLDAAHRGAWEACDADILALCRDRLGMLLRHAPTVDALSDRRRAELSGWPTAAGLSACDRAALAFTEQYVIDVASVTDEQATELCAHLGDEGMVTFVNALLVIEQRMTLELTFDGVL